ncbi:MAG: M14 family metallopeptidase [Planctomycetes bacterium]|nr:M14 family metallopeptidase [Planctomycetota bacterium]
MTTKSPLTKAESSGYTETSLHADVLRFVAELAKRKDKRLFVTHFGKSPEGRELPLLVLSKGGVKTPEMAIKSGMPVVLVINGIHAGEVEGKEASLMLVRDLLDARRDELLDHVILLVVPLFNPDGNDRVDPRNRALDLAKLEGQIGPVKGVGTRVNASGVNLNRDYMKLESLEMRLLQTKVCRAWKPHLTIDCHSTNGSVHRFALTYDVPHTTASGRVEPIQYMREKLLPDVREQVKKLASHDSFYYGNFVSDEGGTGTGWMTYTHHPRFGSNYRGLTNRLDLLLETYSYQPFEQRVDVTYHFVRQTLEHVARNARSVISVVESSQVPPRQIAVRSRLEAFEDPVEILTREPRTLEGAPTSVHIPHVARFVGSVVVDRPAVYLLNEETAQHLERHGLAVERLRQDKTIDVEVATVEKFGDEASRKILEASAEQLASVSWKKSVRRFRAGTPWVKTDQPLGAVAVYLCEPESDDGFVACGVLPTPLVGSEWVVTRSRSPVA